MSPWAYLYLASGSFALHYSKHVLVLQAPASWQCFQGHCQHSEHKLPALTQKPCLPCLVNLPSAGTMHQFWFTWELIRAGTA